LRFGRRFCLACVLYFEVIQPRIGEGPIEDSRPPRFANLVGAIFLTASTVAYGEAQGLDPTWLADLQRFLPRAELTIMLDIAPETAVNRKSVDRDKYERDLALQSRVRESYLRQASRPAWVVLDGERPKDAIAADVFVSAMEVVSGRYR